MKVNLLIPMAGQGDRFRKAGYTTYKPFIEVNGKPMIDHVIDSVPRDVTKYLIVCPELLTLDQRAYLEGQDNTKVIEVPQHKEGPAYSMLKAASELPLDESFIVSYADHMWTWNFDEVSRMLDYDGIVFTRTGFHPHMIKDNFAAFCLPDTHDPSMLARIKEKGSFTDDWMNEPHSMGVYYFKNGNVMVDAIRDEMAKEHRAAGEYYPSQAMNYLVDSGGKVRLSEVPFYIHWGVPSQLDDFNRWRDIIEDLKAGSPSMQYIRASPNIAKSESYGIFDTWKFNSMVEEERPEVVVFRFIPSLTQNKLDSIPGRARVQGDSVISLEDAGIPIADFWWSRSTHLSLEDAVNAAIPGGVKAFPLKHYVSLGTQEERAELEYWTRHSYVFR